MKANYDCRITVVITVLALLVLVVRPLPAAEDHPAVDCDIRNGACVQALGGGSVTLNILPKPVKAMTDLTFQVTLDNLSPAEDPGIDLGMPGMPMGPNHVTLKKEPDGTYTGTGVIVRCPSGRTVWKADVAVPGAGTATFIFNVAY